jgi:hypothetical protein
MRSDNLNSWLTLLANFGVVIGLALLIFELRQTQHLAETEALVRRLNQMQQAQTDFAMSESLPPIVVKAQSSGTRSLSADERIRLQNWESSVSLRMRSQYIQFVRGFLDQETADRIVHAAVERLALWEELGIYLGDNEFEQAIRQAAGRQ